MNKEVQEVKQIDWFDDHFYKIKYINEAKEEVIDYFPSTTTKLGALAKPFLTYWYGDLGTREATLRKDEAADKGTRIHWAWHNYINGGAVIYNPPRTPLYTKKEIAEITKKYNDMVVILTNQNEMWDMMKLQRFVEIVKPVNVASEVILYDIENREAGTADNIFDIEAGAYLINGSTPLMLLKGRYLFDLKTGKSIGEGDIQVADYAVMAEKSDYGHIIGTLIGHTQSRNKAGIEGFGISYQDEETIQKRYKDFRDIANVWDRNFGSRKPVVRQLPGLITLK